ncbi:16500_t:CDS:2, partial [Gigaspora rosea]
KEPEDKRELTHVKVDPFHGSDDEYPIEWLDAFKRAAAMNNWMERRMLKIASGYLRDLTADWYKGKRNDLTQWKNDEEELQVLKQLKHEKVDAYATKFKKLLKQVDPDDEIPDPYIIRMFLSGLRGKAATFVTVAEPKDLDEAITKARKAKANRANCPKLCCIDFEPAQGPVDNDRCWSARDSEKRRTYWTEDSRKLITVCRKAKKGLEERQSTNYAGWVDNNQEGWVEDKVYALVVKRYQPYPVNEGDAPPIPNLGGIPDLMEEKPNAPP